MLPHLCQVKGVDKWVPAGHFYDLFLSLKQYKTRLVCYSNLDIPRVQQPAIDFTPAIK